VRLTPRLSVSDGINAVRTLFPTLWFDAERTADGLQSLRHYVYDVDSATGQFSRNPRHDFASHGADALRYVCVAMQEAGRKTYGTKQGPPRRLIVERGRGQTGWMRS
jgi:phage terminase large subunit